MPSPADFLFGPKRTTVPPVVLRSRVLNASTVFAVQDRVRIYEEAKVADGQGFSPPGTEIYDGRSNTVISREEFLNKHSYELAHISVNGAGEGFQLNSGPVTLLGWDTQLVPGTVGGDIAATIESLSRSRPLWRRLWVLPPWALTAAAVAALVFAIAGGVGPVELLALVVLVAIAALASATASLLIFRAVQAHRPPSIVRPYRWREIVATRLTVAVGVLSGVGGAAIGAVLTWILTHP